MNCPTTPTPGEKTSEVNRIPSTQNPSTYNTWANVYRRNKFSLDTAVCVTWFGIAVLITYLLNPILNN